MILLSLIIRNFKGLPAFTLPAAGRNVNIYGENATGKTTIEDAFLWLFFDKNSDGATKFGIEPTGSRGQGIETSVIAEVEHNGVTFKLEKRRRENWVRKRGSSTDTMDGFIIERFYDGLPMGERDFDALIATLIPAGLSKIITNPLYINEQMDWKDRRAILFSLIGAISDADIIAADKRLEPLAERGAHTVDNWKKVLGESRKRINGELEMVPVKIGELQRGLPDVDPDLTDAGEQKEKLQAEIRRLESELTAAPSDIEQQIKKLKADLATLESENNAYIAKQRAEWQGKQQEEVNRLNREKGGLLTRANEQLSFKQSFDRESALCTSKAASSKADYDQYAARQWGSQAVCMMCNRPYPADQVEQSKRDFNLDKSKVLERKTAERQKLLADAETNRLEADKAASALSDLNKQIEAVDGKIKEVQGKVFSPPYMPGYHKRKMELDGEIAGLMADGAEAEKAKEERYYNLRLEISKLHGQLDEINKLIATTEANRRTRARIAELREQKRTLGAELDAIDKRLNLCEEFTRAKCNLITERVNGMFRIVQWQLFKEQINGGIADCCEAMVGGVPYTDLNNAARINAGLDIINTLSRHHGCTAPIFIDNAEAVTKLEPVDAQVIRLIVSEADKNLRIEVL